MLRRSFRSLAWTGAALLWSALTPLPAAAQVCKVSVDECHDATGTYHVGVNLLQGLGQAACAAVAQSVYGACDLANHPAPASTWPRRARVEFIGDASDSDRTIETTYYPALDPEDLPLRGRSVLGAIRFDLWDSGDLRTPAELIGQQDFKESLEYWDPIDDWQARLPFYTRVDGLPVAIPAARPLNGSIEFDSDVQGVVDQEIVYASGKGLDYWAFVWWNRPSSNGVPQQGVDPLDPQNHWKNVVAQDRSLQLYLSSTLRHRLDFSLIVPIGRFGSLPGYWSDETPEELYALLSDADRTSSWFEVNLEQWVELAAEETYQKVLGDRPLLYIFGSDGFDWWAQGADKQARTRQVMRRIRERFIEAGLANPYIVGMEFVPQTGRGDAADLYRIDENGLDAVTTYAYSLGCNSPNEIDTIVGGAQPNTFQTNPAYDPPDYLSTTFGTLHQSRVYRAQVVDQDGKQLIPNASTGWDPRPEIIPTQYDGVGCGSNTKARWAEYSLNPPATEIATHLSEVVAWVQDNPDNTEANAVLMYAWNELTEGGWLVPTVGEGTARLDAVRNVMCAPTPGLPPQPAGSCGAAPVGNVGHVGDGEIHGWAYDPDVPNRSIRVALYAGGPYPSGTLLAEITADSPNTGVNALGVPGDHRFEFDVPVSRHGESLYVHAIDPVRGSHNPLLLRNGGATSFVHPTECADGEDNGDTDALSDHPADPECNSPSDRSEEPVCNDGLDNDGDGRIDHAGIALNQDGDFLDREYAPDPDCGIWGQGYEGSTEAANCDNQIDDDGDGLADGGVDLDGDGRFYGVEAEADGVCNGQATGTAEKACGLGFEVGFVAPLLWMRLRRTRGHQRGSQ